MTDLFWDVMTSTPVLAAIGAVVTLAFVLAHLPALVAWALPQVEAYRLAAALVQTIAAAALCFLLGFRVSDERAEAQQLRADLAFKERQLEQQKRTADEAAQLQQQAEREASEAKDKLDAFRKTYGDDPAAACGFTGDDIGRLRNLGRAQRR